MFDAKMKVSKLLIAMSIMVALVGCGKKSNGYSEAVKSVEDVYIFTDEETGCEYLMKYKYGIIPRMEKDNQHKGCK